MNTEIVDFKLLNRLEWSGLLFIAGLLIVACVVLIIIPVLVPPTFENVVALLATFALALAIAAWWPGWSRCSKARTSRATGSKCRTRTAKYAPSGYEPYGS